MGYGEGSGEKPPPLGTSAQEGGVGLPCRSEGCKQRGWYIWGDEPQRILLGFDVSPLAGPSEPPVSADGQLLSSGQGGTNGGDLSHCGNDEFHSARCPPSHSWGLGGIKHDFSILLIESAGSDSANAGPRSRRPTPRTASVRLTGSRARRLHPSPARFRVHGLNSDYLRNNQKGGDFKEVLKIKAK